VRMKAAKAASSFFLPRMNDGASKRIGGSGEGIVVEIGLTEL
jgi:hypothetical protein